MTLIGKRIPSIASLVHHAESCPSVDRPMWRTRMRIFIAGVSLAALLPAGVLAQSPSPAPASATPAAATTSDPASFVWRDAGTFKPEKKSYGDLLFLTDSAVAPDGTVVFIGAQGGEGPMGPFTPHRAVTWVGGPDGDFEQIPLEAVSTDALSFERRPVVVHGQAGFVAARFLRRWSSADGRSWTETKVPDKQQGDPVALVATDDGYAVLGTRSVKVKKRQEVRPTMWRSTDGQEWSVTVLDDANQSVHGAAAAPDGTIGIAMSPPQPKDGSKPGTLFRTLTGDTLGDAVEVSDLSAASVDHAAGRWIMTFWDYAANARVSKTSVDGVTWEDGPDPLAFLIASPGEIRFVGLPADDGTIPVHSSSDWENWDVSAMTPPEAGYGYFIPLPDGKGIAMVVGHYAEGDDRRGEIDILIGQPAVGTS